MRKARSETVRRQAFLGSSLSTSKAALAAVRRELFANWMEHPWRWLQGRDEEGEPIIWTKDETDPITPIKPFPNEEYLQRCCEVIFDADAYPLLFFNKPRQVMATWLVMLCVDWFCRKYPARLWLLSKSTEEEAKVMLSDKVQHVHRHLPPWVQEMSTLHAKPAHRYRYVQTQSQLWAVAENAAEREFRGNTASGIVVDEAGFQNHFRDMVAAAVPMEGRVIGLTTANIGNPGAMYCKEIMGLD
jgi:hypothetical protein